MMSALAEALLHFALTGVMGGVRAPADVDRQVILGGVD